MAEARAAAPRSPWRRFSDAVAGSILLVLLYYGLVGLVGLVPVINRFTSVISAVQTGGSILLSVFLAIGLRQAFIDARAQTRSARVSEAIDAIARRPGKAVAEISAAEVAAHIGGGATDADADAITRLVEQQKQQRLIDEPSFQRELEQLIVEYLQPLPRNAKRVMNRFRVNLLIAHSRRMLTAEGGVTAQQIGKWMVLSERWPQLARPLAAYPERMAELERQAAAPVEAAAPGARGGPAPGKAKKKKARPPLDEFMASIELLSPHYVGDEALRRFLCSAPALQGVLPRLVHYRDS